MGLILKIEKELFRCRGAKRELCCLHDKEKREALVEENLGREGELVGLGTAPRKWGNKMFLEVSTRGQRVKNRNIQTGS